MLRPNFVDHLVFRVRDALLGEPYKEDGYSMYMVGETRLFFTPSVQHAAAYHKENIGLNHIALGVRTQDELRQIEGQLNEGGILSGHPNPAM